MIACDIFVSCARRGEEGPASALESLNQARFHPPPHPTPPSPSYSQNPGRKNALPSIFHLREMHPKSAKNCEMHTGFFRIFICKSWQIFFGLNSRKVVLCTHNTCRRR